MTSLVTDKESLAWAAGLFEGEGYFGIKPVGEGYTYAQAIINMTDEDVIRKWHSIIQLGVVYGPRVNTSRLGKKPWWQVSVNGFEKPQQVACLLWPWLGLRRRTQIVNTLRFVRESWLERRELSTRPGDYARQRMV